MIDKKNSMLSKKDMKVTSELTALIAYIGTIHNILQSEKHNAALIRNQLNILIQYYSANSTTWMCKIENPRVMHATYNK